MSRGANDAGAVPSRVEIDVTDSTAFDTFPARSLALSLVVAVSVVWPALVSQPVHAQGRIPARTAQNDAPQPPAASGGQPGPQAQAPASGGNLPPPPRELSPAEVSALQSAMTDRSSGAILTPGNVGLIRNRVIDAQSAANAPGYSDEAPPKVKPKLMVVQPQVDMSSPQLVHLAFGMVTPITILDGQGRPWPITASAYDPRMFAVDGGGCGGQAVAPAERPPTIHIMPCRVATYGNISITLENYPLPVVLIVKSGGRGLDSVDLPVTIEVRGRSPSQARTTAEADAPATGLPSLPARLLDQAPIGAKHTALDAAAPAAPIRYVSGRSNAARSKKERIAGGFEPDRLMDDFGSGTPPRSAQRLNVDDPSVSAWTLGGRLYVRGPVIVVNPVQDAMAETQDGQRVWRFDRPVPRLLVTDAGGGERAVNIEY